MINIDMNQGITIRLYRGNDFVEAHNVIQVSKVMNNIPTFHLYIIELNTVGTVGAICQKKKVERHYV